MVEPHCHGELLDVCLEYSTVPSVPHTAYTCVSKARRLLAGSGI